MSTRICFDIDGTLVTFKDRPRLEVIALLYNHWKLGCDITVWSGGGKEYAEMWVRRLFLEEYVSEIRNKPSPDEVGPLLSHKKYDIVYDDEWVNYGKVNIKV